MNTDRIRLLVVDDSPYVLEAIERTLRCIEADWEMQTTDNAVDALNLFRSREFDALVTDLKMPGMDGEELVREISSLRPGTACVVLSGDIESPQARSIAGRGYALLEKPCDTRALRTLIVDQLVVRAA